MIWDMRKMWKNVLFSWAIFHPRKKSTFLHIFLKSQIIPWVFMEFVFKIDENKIFSIPTFEGGILVF